ncbi:mini-ribonuclease 3 [Mycoplasma sp. CAG:611]|nr:mini-ribonuclease 3 [Mycoplasma sp. CAG:611]
MEYNSLVLAYIGDAIYEVLVRKYLIDKGFIKVNDLQKEALNYVSAKNQALFLKELLNNDFFTTYEIEIIKRARNTKTHSKPKNCDILTYKHATALESVFGYLYMNNKYDRIKEIFDYIEKIKEVILC